MRRSFSLFVLAALLYGGIVKADVDSLMRFAGNIHQFNSIYPQEKVYLQFDNTSYYPGETIWFKAFVVNASTLKRAPSKVLYVDLISPEGVLLKQQKLMIVAGQADGMFTLEDESTQQARELRGVTRYSSGFYEVRAYTNYMQNFGVDVMFSRVLAVFDNPKKEGHYYDEKPSITPDKNNITPVRPKTSKLKDVNVSFYPEGGHIIIGQPCRVAFKVTGKDGLGIGAMGTFDDEITFSTQHDGMGYFVITPQSERNSVRITVDGRSHSYNLPDAEPSGCTVQAAAGDQDKVSFNIYSSADIINRELGMTLTCRGELVDFAKTTVSGSEIQQTFDLSSAPEGVIRFTLFNNDGDILATRSFYHETANTAIPSIDVTPGKNSYAPFEKMTLDFNLTDGRGNPFRDRFCLSVRDSRGQTSIYEDDLRTNMLLSSDLKGFIENPEYYFNTSNPERREDLDLLCLVQGWERYDWRAMAGVEKFNESFRLEDKGLTLNGWVVRSVGRKPVSDVEVNASIVPTDKRLTESYRYMTDERGYFGFDIGVLFYGKARFTIKASPQDRNLRKEGITIMFDRSRFPTIRPYAPEEMVFVSKALRTDTEKDATESVDVKPDVISVNTGVVLPDVDINERRRYVDYDTFKAYDVSKDVEKELDKGNYSTELFGYLKDLGYDVQIGIVPETAYKIAKRDSGPRRIDYKLLREGLYVQIYAHTETKYYDLDKESYNTMGADGEFDRDDPSFIGARIDTRDIKSIMFYDRPMFLQKAYELSPLFLKQANGMDAIMGIDPALAANDTLKSSQVYLLDVMLKNINESSPRKDQFDRSRRFTTVEGYSVPYSFYSPEYPDGPIPGDVDYRRTLYWNPNVITDENGHAHVEFYNNSYSSSFSVSGAGITASGIPYILDTDL